MKLTAIPFAGAFSEALGMILEKKILRKKKVDTRAYNTFSFFWISVLAILSGLVLGTFFPELFSLKFNPETIQLKNIAIMLGVIVSSVAANLFTFYAMKWEKLTEIEPMRLMQPLFTIILALIIYSSERNVKTQILFAALVASLTLIFSHIRKHHFSLNKYAWAAIFGSFFFALELVISKSILILYTPLSFYLVRCVGIFLISLILFKPNPDKIDKKTWFMIICVSFVWILYRMLLYFSYDISGVVVTTLLFILTPVFLYALSYIYLKEKPSWRNIVASIIIVLCVAYALWINGV
jgi:drug/metabolite transporter (DMT)-like permease